MCTATSHMTGHSGRKRWERMFSQVWMSFQNLPHCTVFPGGVFKVPLEFVSLLLSSRPSSTDTKAPTGNLVQGESYAHCTLCSLPVPTWKERAGSGHWKSTKPPHFSPLPQREALEMRDRLKTCNCNSCPTGLHTDTPISDLAPPCMQC
jgi:hypothetical protein